MIAIIRAITRKAAILFLLCFSVIMSSLSSLSIVIIYYPTVDVKLLSVSER